MRKLIFPRSIGVLSYWIRIVLAKVIVIATALAVLWAVPSLPVGEVMLFASTALIPFENYFAVIPRGRGIGEGRTARWISFLPILREFYVMYLSIAVRSPLSCVYNNPFDESADS